VFDVYRAAWSAGYPAELHAIEAQGKRSYDVRIGNLNSEADANALAARLTGQYGITKPSVLR
jgi:phosphoheptose isomerase